MGQGDLIVTARVVVPERELSFFAVRSSGPGGQNVNKVASKVDLRWAFRGSVALDAAAKERLSRIATSRIDAGGRICVVSQATRDQGRNLADAREKLRLLILAALTPPRRRRATKPSRAAKARRLDAKRHQSDKKQARRSQDGRGR